MTAILGDLRQGSARFALTLVLGACAAALFATPALAVNGPPIVTKTSYSQLTDSTVELEAVVNPNGRKTTYYFQYITQVAFEADGGQFGAGTQSTTPAVISSPSELALDHRAAAPVTGLHPGTAYRFRLFAENFNSPLGGSPGPTLAFATFSTTQSFAGACPQNEELRSGPSSRLPDCRAYEQATPVDKNGADPEGTLFSVEASLSGDAITSYTLAGLPGATGFQSPPAFISRRVGGSWKTEGLLPPASYGESASVQAWTPDLALSFSRASFVNISGTERWLARQTADGSITTVISGAKGAFVAASADNSKVFYQNKSDGKLYRYDRDTGATTLVSLLPDSACGSPPCPLTNAAFAGPYDWWNASLTKGGAEEYFVREDGTVSSAGDSIYFTEAKTGDIYRRQGLDGPSPTTVQVNASEKDNGAGLPGNTDAAGQAPAAFQVASADGNTAYFTSTEKLTNDANTGPEPEAATIGRAKLGGAEAEEKEEAFLPQKGTGVAVGGEYLYWANPAANRIDRAKVTASGHGPVEPGFIEPGETCFESYPHLEPGVSHCALSTPRYVAVANGYLYWTNTGPLGSDEEVSGSAGKYIKLDGPAIGAGTIGRAKLDGSGNLVPNSVEPKFITGASNPTGIAVSASHIYWANPLTFRVSRAGVEGESGSIEQNFSEASSNVKLQGMTLDNQYVYWSEEVTGSLGGGFVGRKPLEGGGRETIGICNNGDFCKPRGVAVVGNNLYWAAQGNNEIGRFPLSNFGASGSSYNLCIVEVPCESEFIGLTAGPIGLAIDFADERIYWSTNGETLPNAGSDLYRFEAEKPAGERLTDLTADSTDTNGAEVQGVLGASTDGSYVYFVANADLDGAQGPAEMGNCRAPVPANVGGTCNLYLHHGGETTFVAELKAPADIANWRTFGSTGITDAMIESRVSPDGRTLLFRSVLPATSYDSHGVSELYRYEAGSGQIDCLGCNPTGAPPSGFLSLKQSDQAHVNAGHISYSTQPILSRNLSPDGKRVVFETDEKLVAADVNGEAGQKDCQFEFSRGPAPTCTDVYEWEAPGEGSCTAASSAYVPANGGCLYLLSAGTGAFPSTLGDISANGDVVFIYTRDQLVPADGDDLQDIYAVAVDGGLPSQHVSTPPSCGSPAECRGKGTSAPSLSGAGSAAFAGAANKKQPHLRDCEPAAKRAQELARESKVLNRKAARAKSPADAQRLRHQSALAGKRAHSLSKDAKHCRRANRKASR